MQSWKKLGLIFSADKKSEWMHSHASLPIVVNADERIITVLFSTRDKHQVSSVSSLQFDIKSLQIQFISDKPLLTKGKLGCFDDSGVMASCVLSEKDNIFLYYIGWNLGGTVPFRNSIGLANSTDGGKTFNRLYEGPLLDRTRDEPYFVASNCVIVDNNIYKMWYLSCTEWFLDCTGKPMHKYHIKYAESSDGINWNRKGKVAIDYNDIYEYAISVPRVIRDKNKYRMWFSSRASKHASTYRIRYAESIDGISWSRDNDEIALDVSNYGWDSEMVCYPYVFDHQGKRYMLYNGNSYGKTGFGLAILENE